MRNRILIIFGIVVLVSGAFGVGILVQRQIQLARIRAGEAFARDLAGLNDPIPAAPQWDEWCYPKAKLRGTAGSAAVNVSDKLVHPAGRYAVCVTPDALETVARFYTGKMGFEDPDAIARSELAFSSEGNIQGESRHVLDDYRDVDEMQKKRPIRTKCLVRGSPSFDVTVFLTRAESESETHIVLLHERKTDIDHKQ